MEKVFVDKDFLEDGLELICGAIRLKTGGTGLLAFPVEMKEAVDSITSTGITPTGTKEITENTPEGETVDVTSFAAVKVAVPTGITPSGTLEITANTAEGETVDVSEYAAATVAVPTGITPSGTLAITENTAAGQTVDVTNYAAATVAVPTGGYDETVMNTSTRLATAATNKKLTVQCTILNTEGFGGVYITGRDRTNWVICSMLLMKNDSSGWIAFCWRKQNNDFVYGEERPAVTVQETVSGNSTTYAINIELGNSAYSVFNTAAENYSVIPIRMRKS